MDRLTELILSIAREEWHDQDSTTCKNRRSIPGDLRDGFVMLADMGGVCVLDSRGSIRVFLHDGAEEIEPSDWVIRSALEWLDRSHPELAQLMRDRG